MIRKKRYQYFNKSATRGSKRDLFAALNEDEQLLGVIQPWIEIAEGEGDSWEKALQQSLDSLNSIEINVSKRTYI